MSTEDTQPFEAPRFASGFPREFGNYILCASFGQGGMGEVFLAKHGEIAGLEQLCIVKKIHSQQLTSQTALGRFIDEARISIHMQHGNLCHVFDVGQVDGDFFLAMEYVPGVDLRMLLTRLTKSRATIPVHLVCYIITEVLDPLVYAHRLRHPVTNEPLNLVHRDISPQNIMINYEGGVKLIDFGIASSSLKQERTESHQVVGKVAYMSPEQARGEQVDATTDQFAMAVVACELLMRDRFYGQMSAHEIWQRVGKGGYRPQGFRTIHEPVRLVLDRALATTPEKRFADADEFREALLDAVADQPRTGRKVLREWIQGLFTQQLERERRFVSLCNSLDTIQFREGRQNDPRSIPEDQTKTSQSPSMPNSTLVNSGVSPAQPPLEMAPFKRHLLEEGRDAQTQVETVSQPNSIDRVAPQSEIEPKRRAVGGASLALLLIGVITIATSAWLFHQSRSIENSAIIDHQVSSEPQESAGPAKTEVSTGSPNREIRSNQKPVQEVSAEGTVSDAGDHRMLERQDSRAVESVKKDAPQKERRRAKQKKRTKKKAKLKNTSETQTAPPKAAAPKERSLQDKLRLIQSCSRKCAQALNKRFKGNHVFVTAEQKPAIEYCARRCAE